MSEPRFRIKIDGTFVFKGTVDDWQRRAPDDFRKAIKPGATPQPWMKAIMVALSDGIMERRAMDIFVETQGNGWSMEVTTS
jgi:hypothetical protein